MIYLVRQGQTDWNLFRRFNGTTETFLNTTGITQAQKLASALKDVHFDICFCSPLQRAIQTCEIICKENIELDDRLIEIDCGDFEGTEETPESMRLFWQAVQSGTHHVETFKHFLGRHQSFCKMLSLYKDKNILIVTHAANTRAIDYFLNGMPHDYDFSKAVVKSGEYLTYNFLCMQTD